MSTSRAESSANGARFPSASLTSRPWSPIRARLLLHPDLERGPRVAVERAVDLVELHGRRDLRLGERAAVGERLGVRAPRRELDVGLAQQRLLAQDRARVRGHRRVPRLQLDRHGRPAGLIVGLDRLDPPDRHAGDPHVGLGGERGRLGERDVEPVALRLERDRAAERQPQEQEQPEARQREHHHRGDPAERRGGLVHGVVPPGCGQISAGDGLLRRSTSVPSAGLVPATVCSSCAVLHESTTMPWRIGPWASCVANTVAPAWFSHEAQNR